MFASLHELCMRKKDFLRKISFILFDLIENLFHDIKTKEQKMKNIEDLNKTLQGRTDIEYTHILSWPKSSVHFDSCTLVGYFDTPQRSCAKCVHEQLLCVCGQAGSMQQTCVKSSPQISGAAGKKNFLEVPQDFG